MLYFFVLLTIITFRISQADDWFGPSNNFRCHCTTGCNSEGFCLNNGECISGWFGIKCQCQNIANNGTLNPPQYSSILNDGDNTTCIDDSSLQLLEVKWDTPYPFTWMRLVVKNQSSQNVVISYKETTLSNEVICLNQKLLWIDANTVDIQCKLQNTIQQFKISGEIVKSICELAISGGRNVALKCMAEQHSTFFICGAHLAVDGSTDTYYSNCSQTGDMDLYPYWKVQLQNSIAVNRYVIFNRDDYCTWCPKRLDYFNLSALNSQNQIVFNYYDQYGMTEQVYMINDINNSIISQVNISQRHIVDGHNWPVITLCEVEIYGECPVGFWGMECTNKCDTNCSDSCIADGGWCPIQTNCLGFTNPPICNIPCDKYSFGLNCSQRCSNYCLAGTCKHESGECNSCFQGYHGTYCTLIFENNRPEEISWRKYFGFGFVAGVGSLTTIMAIVLMTVIFRCIRSKGSNPNKHKEQVYNQPEMFHLDKHSYETVDKSEIRVDKQYENIGDITDFE